MKTAPIHSLELETDEEVTLILGDEALGRLICDIFEACERTYGSSEIAAVVAESTVHELLSGAHFGRGGSN